MLCRTHVLTAPPVVVVVRVEGSIRTIAFVVDVVPMVAAMSAVVNAAIENFMVLF